MTSNTASESNWGSHYRLVAAEKWRPKSAAMGRSVTEALVEYAKPEAGMRVLDLATGTGEPAISLAAAVGPQGQVTALDLSRDLLEIAAQRAQDRGLTNFRTEQADAHTLPFPDNWFDLAASRFGVMFFRDPDVAARELLRVLGAGARACFLVWGSPDQPYWQSTFGVVHRQIGGPMLPADGPNPFRYAEPGSLSKVLRSAGFQQVSEETRRVPWTWPGTAEEVWQYARSVSVPFRAMLETVPEERWPEINAEVHRAVRRYWDGENISFGAEVILASGSKPA